MALSSRTLALLGWLCVCGSASAKANDRGSLRNHQQTIPKRRLKKDRELIYYNEAVFGGGADIYHPLPATDPYAYSQETGKGYVIVDGPGGKGFVPEGKGFLPPPPPGSGKGFLPPPDSGKGWIDTESDDQYGKGWSGGKGGEWGVVCFPEGERRGRRLKGGKGGSKGKGKGGSTSSSGDALDCYYYKKPQTRAPSEAPAAVQTAPPTAVDTTIEPTVPTTTAPGVPTVPTTRSPSAGGETAQPSQGAGPTTPTATDETVAPTTTPGSLTEAPTTLTAAPTTTTEAPSVIPTSSPTTAGGVTTAVPSVTSPTSLDTSVPSAATVGPTSATTTLPTTSLAPTGISAAPSQAGTTTPTLSPAPTGATTTIGPTTSTSPTGLLDTLTPSVVAPTASPAPTGAVTSVAPSTSAAPVGVALPTVSQAPSVGVAAVPTTSPAPSVSPAPVAAITSPEPSTSAAPVAAGLPSASEAPTGSAAPTNLPSAGLATQGPSVSRSPVAASASPSSNAATATPTAAPSGQIAAASVGKPIDASSFAVIYSLPSELTALPSNEDFSAAAVVVQVYLRDFLIQHYESKKRSTLYGVTVTSLGNTGSTDTVGTGFDLTATFAENSAKIPSQEDLNVLVRQALPASTVNGLVTLLNNMVSSNPLSSTEKVSYSSDVVSASDAEAEVASSQVNTILVPVIGALAAVFAVCVAGVGAATVVKRRRVVRNDITQCKMGMDLGDKTTEASSDYAARQGWTSEPDDTSLRDLRFETFETVDLDRSKSDESHQDNP